MNSKDIIFIEKADMASIYKTADISNLAQIAYYHFMNCEDEVLYILNDKNLSGVFSIGDLERFYNTDSDQIEINSQYVYVNRENCEEAEGYFKNSITINEIPVVTKDKELLGVMKKNKAGKLRQKQRDSLRFARANQWHRKEIERFINHTKAKVMLYTYSNELIMSHWDDDTVQVLKKRRGNSDSDWMGLSDDEWVNFWQDEYEDGLIGRMRVEAEECNIILKDGKAVFGDKKGEFYSCEGGYRVTRNNPPDADRKIVIYGPCIVFGAYCKDDQTIAYYLQDYLNEQGYSEWRVINRGLCGPEDCYNQMFMERFSENDIVILLGESERIPNRLMTKVVLYKDLSPIFMNIPLLINNIVDSPMHCNYIVNHKIAKEISGDICSTGVVDGTRQVHSPKEIQEYYISWSMHEYFEEYFKKYELSRASDNISVGAIVMNCNPFTKGHRFLIEQAIEQVDKLYIFVVEEDSSYFKFSDRFAMVKEGISDLQNIYVIPSGKYIISKDTFAQYFNKEQVTLVDSMDYDVYIFGEVVAAKLGIRYRFVGEEPLDRVTQKYNESLKRILPNFGVTVIEIPRCMCDVGRKEEIVSASFVREALQKKDINTLKKLCSESTMKYMIENEMI